MGIQSLMKLISEKASDSILENEMKNYFGRRIAIDASMSIYQFLIAMKAALGGEGDLTNEAGEITSHLQGMWSRTIRMMSQGIKPVYVFDGAPPKLKDGTLAARNVKSADATEQMDKAKEEGDTEEVIKLSKRSVRATREQIADCKRLVELMGLPAVQAAGEAEATCARLVSSGKCWATGTEDMDALTFGTSRLIRHLNFSDAKKMPIIEIHLDRVLAGMKMTMDQFIDVCILLGCDYCPKINGIGPQKAYDGIMKYGCLEKFLEQLDTTKFKVPENYPYEEIRQIFRNPDVTDMEEKDLLTKDPDEEGLIKFLVEEKMFARDRVEKGIKRLQEFRTKKTQNRLDSYFTVSASAGMKRKRDEKAPEANKRAKKTIVVGKKK